MPATRVRPALPIALGIVVFLIGGTIARGQSTWQGGGTDTTWSTADNWSTSLVNGFNTGLVFQGSSGLANTNDLTSGTATSITFNAGAGAFTIGGNALALTGNIANNSSNLQSIANNITLLANSTVTGTNVTLSGAVTNSGGNLRLTNGLGTGDLLTLGAINLSEGDTGRTFQLSGTGNTTISGAIADGGSGAGSFAVGGSAANAYSGTVTFAGNSTYSGTTTLTNNTLVAAIGGGSAFGSSVVNFNNHTSTGGAIATTDVTLTNRINIGTTFTVGGTNSIELSGPTYFTAGTSLTSAITGAGKQLKISGTFFLQESGVANATRTLGGNIEVTGDMKNSADGQGSTGIILGNAGTLSLSGSNNYSGGTTISSNQTYTLVLGNKWALGTGSLNYNTGILTIRASADLGGSNAVSNGVTLASTNLTISGSNNIGLTGTLTNSGGDRRITNSLDAGRQFTLGAINLSNNDTSRILYLSGSGVTGSATTSITGPIADGGAGAGRISFSTSGGSSPYIGTVMLTGSSSYSGGTYVYLNSAVTLVLGDKSALGQGDLFFKNGSLTIQASTDLAGSNALANSFEINAGKFATVSGSNSITFRNLTNATGGNTITNNLSAGKTLSFSGTTFLQESGTGVGRTLTVSGSGNTTFSGPIVNGGTGGVSALVIDNTGTTTLSGINTYPGTTRLGNFNGTTTVVIATGSAFGSGEVSTGAATTNGGNPVIIASDDVTLANNFHILAGNTSQNTITFGGTKNITLSGTVYSTNQSVAKRIDNSITGSGTLTLSGGINLSHNGARSNNFGGTGNTIVSGSIYQAAGATGSLTLDGSGTTTLSGTNSYTGGTGVSGGGVLLLKSGSALPGGIGTTGGQSNLVVSNGIIGLGAGNFTRGLGTGTTQVNLTGTSGFAAFGDNRFVNIGGASGTMTWGATNFTSGPLLLSAAGADGTLDFQNPLDLNASVRTVAVANGSAAVDATFSGVLSGNSSAGLMKTGAGTLTLAAANTFGGALTVEDGAVSIATINNASANGPLGNSAGAVVLGSVGKAGLLSYTGATASSNKPFTAATGGTAVFAVTDAAATLTLSGAIGGSGNVSFGGPGSYVLSGGVSAGNLAKTGAGGLTLASANTYVGDTILNSGTLKLSAGGSFANTPRIVVGDAGSTGAVLDLTEKSSFSIGASQSLMGGGLVNLGASTVLTVSGTFSPGNSPGLFTYSSGTTLLAGTTLMEVWGTSRATSPSHGDGFYDAVNVTNGGVLSFGDSILTLSFDSLFNDGDTFQLFQAIDTSSLAGNFGSVNVTGSYYTDLTWTKSGFLWESSPAIGGESLSFNAATGTLSVVIVVPEPGAVALAGIGIAIAFWSLRKRQRVA